MKKKIKITLIIIIIINFILGIEIFGKEIPKNEMEDITANNILIAETDTGRILYQKKVDKKIYPASITKLLTAILVVENCELDEIVIVSENAVKSVPSGYVNANLQIGEELTVSDLLNVMLIPSANDAANALAEHVGGSIESFSTMMNTRAKELGCTSSNFTNPSGLHQEEHYTTARDILYISQEAISNKIIKNIIKKVNYTLPKTNKYTGASRIFTNTNYIIRKEMKEHYYKYCIGGKTGYTGEAKNCVVAFYKKDGIQLTAIIMGENASVKGKKFLDANKLAKYIYKNFEEKNIVNADEKYETVTISNGTRETKKLNVNYENDVRILESKDINIENIEKQVEYKNLKAPITKGDIIGIIKYTYEGTKYETNLIAQSDVEESKILNKILYIMISILIIYIIHNYKKSKKKKKSNNYYRKRAKTVYK